MNDSVHLADVLARAYGRADLDPSITTWEFMAQAVIAYGDGDPVVVMPGGTLKRLSRYYPDNLLTDPVAE